MDISAIQSPVSVAAVSPLPPPERVAENRELIRAVKALNGTGLFGSDRELSFGFDRETRHPVIRIVDRNTGEVIQQVPPEYALRMAEDLTA
jgi:uncharacterized FlaG/YvyC family protein